jgi:hypothetical protein
MPPSSSKEQTRDREPPCDSSDEKEDGAQPNDAINQGRRKAIPVVRRTANHQRTSSDVDGDGDGDVDGDASSITEMIACTNPTTLRQEQSMSEMKLLSLHQNEKQRSVDDPSEAVPKTSLERSRLNRAVLSQPGAVPVTAHRNGSHPTYTNGTANASSHRNSNGEAGTILLTAQLVDNQDADVEVGHHGAASADVEQGEKKGVVLASPLEQPQVLQLLKLRYVQIFLCTLFLVIIGLVVGLVIGLTQSTNNNLPSGDIIIFPEEDSGDPPGGKPRSKDD